MEYPCQHDRQRPHKEPAGQLIPRNVKIVQEVNLWIVDVHQLKLVVPGLARLTRPRHRHTPLQQTPAVRSTSRVIHRRQPPVVGQLTGALAPLATRSVPIIRLAGQLVNNALRSQLLHQPSDSQPHYCAVGDINAAKKPLGSTSPQCFICLLIEIQLRWPKGGEHLRLWPRRDRFQRR